MLIPFSAAFYIGDVPLHHEYTILLSPLPLTESLRVMKSIQSKKAVLAHFIWHHNFFSHFFVTISDSEGLHHFFFFFCWNAPCLDYICNRQEPKWSCSTAGSTRLFIWWGKEDPKKTQTPEFAFVASHQQRRCSKGASTWQIPLKSPLFSPSVLAWMLAFTLTQWNVPSSLTHCRQAAGRLFTGISDTPCPWITLGGREITAFCHLACQSLAPDDRRWMRQKAEQPHSEKRGRWQKERCLIKNVFFLFDGQHSCKHQTLTGSDFLSAFTMNVPQKVNFTWKTQTWHCHLKF